MTVLLVLFTLIAFLVADYLAQKAKLAKAARQVGNLLPSRPALPAGVGLAQNHTWLKTGTDGVAVIGLDELLSRIVGRIDELILPQPGAMLAATEPALVLRQGTKTLRLASPVSGRVTAVNNEAAAHASSLKRDPYGKGWLLQVQMEQGSNTVPKMVGTNASEWLRQQTDLLRRFFAGQNPQMQIVTMQDGGEPADGLLEQFTADVWGEFNQQFASLPEDEIPIIPSEE